MHLAARSALLFTHSSCSDDRDPRRRPADDSSQEVDDMTDDRSGFDRIFEADFETEDALDLVVCPECGAPAEVVDRFALPSTDGPVEHAKVLCLMRHWFLLPVAALPTVGSLDHSPETGPVR
jgi:hypothetical protein